VDIKQIGEGTSIRIKRGRRMGFRLIGRVPVFGQRLTEIRLSISLAAAGGKQAEH